MKHDSRQPAGAGTAPRKTYAPPRLEALGLLRERTLGISGGVGESGGDGTTKRNEDFPF